MWTKHDNVRQRRVSFAIVLAITALSLLPTEGRGARPVFWNLRTCTRPSTTP